MSEKDKLFDQFPPVSTQEWMDKIQSDLKGADFNKKLVWKTNEGIDVKPFYRAEDLENLMYINTLPGEFPYIRGTKIKDNNWYIRQDIKVTDYTEANRKALEILMKGIDSLGFIIDDPESVSIDNFEILLSGIQLESIEVNFLCNGKAKEILENILRIVIDRGLDTDKIQGAIEADPVGRLMLNGKLCIPVEDGLNYLASLTRSASILPKFRTLHIKASAFGNAGADIVQELAFGISMGSEYMSQLTERGLSPDIAASKIRFSFGVGSGYFPEIAKLRAARLLWSVVLNGFIPEKGESVKMDIHCVTTEWNKTVYDPYVNMLRTQTEAMSAILGGTDSLTVEPFDISFRQPNEFSERIARNQQLILKEEAYFDKVADPSAGSYYIENLTSLIAESAWKLFLEIEDKGGFLACLKSGVIQEKLSESAGRRKKDVATRKTILLGTNQYPNTEETVSPSVDISIAFSRKPIENDLMVEQVTLFRGSEEYDKLRMAVDKSQRRPVVFLLAIGNPLMRKARAQFSSNFFGCAGYNIIGSQEFSTVETGIKSAVESKADIVVICSADDEYLQYAPEIYTGLKDKTIVVVAGNPVSADELRSKGLELYIHMKSDVTETLRYFNTLLGITM